MMMVMVPPTSFYGIIILNEIYIHCLFAFVFMLVALCLLCVFPTTIEYFGQIG